MLLENKRGIYIGTSGWSYAHWRRNFFPEDLSPSKWLNYLSGFFSTVEINATFYRMPNEKTVKNWFKQVPGKFYFSVKASRYITHQKRLIDCQDSLNFFYKNIQYLKNKRGPILFQLPPSFKLNKERIEQFISLLDKSFQHVFEFRHDSWFNEEIYSLLRKNNIGLCITDLNGKLSPEVITADFTYIRLHGPKKAYQGSYSPSELDDWKKRFKNGPRLKFRYFVILIMMKRDMRLQMQKN